MKYKLSDIFQKPISGEWGSELEEGKKGVKVLRTTNFTNLGRLNLNDVVEREIDINKHRSKILKQGDIIIEKSGGSPTQPVGRVVIFEEGGNEIYFCNNFTSILRPQKLINSKYSLYLMKDLYNKRKVLKYQNKTTGIINLKLADYIANTEIILPTINVQIKIAKVLDKAQELIDKRKEQIQALDELTKSQFMEMFGDPIINKNNYDVRNLEEICLKITDGTHNSPPNTTEGVPYVTAKHLKEYGLDFYSDPTYISIEDHESIYKRCNPEIGDVLYIKDGATTGIAGINNYDFEFSMLSSLALLKLKTDIINNNYLVKYLNNESVKNKIISDMVGGAIKRLTLVRIKNIKIVVPPIELQNQFADFVKQTDRLKLKMEKSLKELEDNFNSLMQRAFNGELFSE